MNVDAGGGANTNDRANDRNMFTVRGQYRVTPNDDVDVVLIGDYSKRNEVCCVGVATVLGPFAGVANAIASVPPLGGRVGATATAPAGGDQGDSNISWGGRSC